MSRSKSKKSADAPLEHSIELSQESESASQSLSLSPAVISSQNLNCVDLNRVTNQNLLNRIKLLEQRVDTLEAHYVSFEQRLANQIPQLLFPSKQQSF